MEEERAQADLGEAVDAELSAENPQRQNQPRKRFIGRKEAAERAEKRGNPNSTIEDTGAIQGMERVSSSTNRSLTLLSCPTKEDGSSAQPSSSRNPPRFRDQRCHIASPSKLLLRNTQDNT